MLLNLPMLSKLRMPANNKKHAHLAPASSILWHFTGGPRWHKKLGKQRNSPKPNAEARSILLAILKSSTLKLGSYRECVRILISDRKNYDRRKRRLVKVPDREETIETMPVCCLADIPLAQLPYHSVRYGKYAIGFHRARALKAGFQPVFYALSDQPIIQELFGARSSIAAIDTERAGLSVDSLVSDMEGALEEMGGEDFSSPDATDVHGELEELESEASSANEGLFNALSFVKTFSATEFETIYCEREWRSLKDFSFVRPDVAMLVVPSADRDVVRKVLDKQKNVWASVKVISWDEIVTNGSGQRW